MKPITITLGSPNYTQTYGSHWNDYGKYDSNNYSKSYENDSKNDNSSYNKNVNDNGNIIFNKMILLVWITKKKRVIMIVRNKMKVKIIFTNKNLMNMKMKVKIMSIVWMEYMRLTIISLKKLKINTKFN